MKLLEREEVLEREQTEITREVEPARQVDRPVVEHRFGWKQWLVVGLAVAAIAAIAIAVVTSGGDDPVTVPDEVVATPAVVESGHWPYTDEEIELMRLARAGYIPREAVDWELMQLKDLVVRGLVPKESLLTPPHPLLVGAQLNPAIEENNELLRLYRGNHIPREAVDWQLLELVDLVNRGHVPIESLYIPL